ncbi:izumo sperm-egg fusion protein 1-like isoform X2 [Marmota marmota marmota]|uniref:izumo sperm-egg fusion protein 1-like isoform X2 n=1 Tax=Marmota marmota marmota TaxID=9994 RepID=UPI002093E3DD|nr:izumo sperm-egg fusion protein 1-like isoform X2 [Marmota marmota marmota]
MHFARVDAGMKVSVKVTVPVTSWRAPPALDLGERTLLVFSTECFGSMGLCFALPLAALASCLLPADCCITCDPTVIAAVKSLETDYLPGHLDAKGHKKLMDIVHKTMNEFKELPIKEGSYMGAVDEKTIKQAASNFLRELKVITDSDVEGEEFVRQLYWMLDKEKGDFMHESAQFLKEAFCPNKCGVMLQTLIWCRNCEKEVHTCLKSKTCGERHVEVHEMEDMILDCLLTWHHISEGLTDYKFYRVWENNSETLLYKGKESTLTKPRVSEADEGKYRCQLDTVKSGPATIISYRVKVIPPNAREEKPGSHIETEEEGANIPVIPDQPETIITTTTTHSSDTESLFTGENQKRNQRPQMRALKIQLLSRQKTRASKENNN